MFDIEIETPEKIDKVKEELKDEYNSILSNIKRKEEAKNSLYLNVQILISVLVIAVCFFFRSSQTATFEYVKEGYTEFFNTEYSIQSNFSLNSFIVKMQEELYEVYNEFISIYNTVLPKGSGDYPSNVSEANYILEYELITPAQGYISSQFGYRTNPFNSKEREFHTGLDIAAQKGSFIKSALDGVVLSAGYSNIAGNFIVIKTDDAISTMYGHLQFMLVKEGDIVKAGQVIATMGSTGMSTGSHLHFELRINDIRYNPLFALDL